MLKNNYMLKMNNSVMFTNNPQTRHFCIYRFPIVKIRLILSTDINYPKTIPAVLNLT